MESAWSPLGFDFFMSEKAKALEQFPKEVRELTATLSRGARRCAPVSPDCHEKTHRVFVAHFQCRRLRSCRRLAYGQGPERLQRKRPILRSNHSRNQHRRHIRFFRGAEGSVRARRILWATAE